MARFFNEHHEKLFVLAPQTDDDDSNFLLGYRAELDEIFSSFQPLQIEAYTGAIASNDRSQSAGPTEHFYKGVRRIIAGHIQFRSEAQAERAYALFNDTYIIAKLSRKSRIRMEFLYYNVDDLLELPALLVVSGIPAAIQDWFPETFDAFRHFGTMMKCQRRHRCAIHQCSNAPTTGECPESHDPTVVLQYASKDDSDRALAELNGTKVLVTCILSITVKGTLKPSEKSADYGKRPSSYKTKVSTTYVRPPHEASSGSSSNNLTYQRAQQPQQPQEPEPSSSGQYQRLELKPAMDLCNIYIKHIDRSLKSAELYNLFERFGRIISARVMEDPATGISRGFGFVSYSHPTEAAAALLEMNGYDSSADSDKLGTGEMMSVRFHEPRVPRPERDHQQQVIKLLQSPLAGHFSFEHVLPINDTSAPETETSGGLVGHAPPPPPLIMPQSSMFYSPYSPSPTQTSQPVSPFTMHHNYHHQNSPIFPHSPYMIPHSPRSGNNPYFYYYTQQQPVMHEYYSPQMMHQLQQQPRPPYPARQQQQQQQQQQQLVDTKETEYLEENKDQLTGQDEDEESLGTGTSESTSKRAEAITRASSPPDGGHQRLLEAVQQKLPQGDEAKINMIVDRLTATLTRKERSLCLFNEEYLERQIRQVLEWQ